MIALESHDLPRGQAACTPDRLKHMFAIFRGHSALPGHLPPLSHLTKGSAPAVPSQETGWVSGHRQTH